MAYGNGSVRKTFFGKSVFERKPPRIFPPFPYGCGLKKHSYGNDRANRDTGVRHLGMQPRTPGKTTQQAPNNTKHHCTGRTDSHLEQ